MEAPSAKVTLEIEIIRDGVNANECIPPRPPKGKKRKYAPDLGGTVNCLELPAPAPLCT